MTINRIVFAVAGTMVLSSIALGHYVNENWLWLGVFVGANMLQSAFTRFCPLVKILKALGFRESAATV